MGVRLEPLIRILIPIRPSPASAETSADLRGLPLGRRLPLCPSAPLPLPLPLGPSAGWRRRVSLQLRRQVRWATDSLLAVLLPPNSSWN